MAAAQTDGDHIRLVKLVGADGAAEEIGPSGSLHGDGGG